MTQATTTMSEDETDESELTFEKANDLSGWIMAVLVGGLSILGGIYLSRFFGSGITQVIAGVIIPFVLFSAFLMLNLIMKLKTGVISKDHNLLEQAKTAYSKGQISEEQLEEIIEVLESDSGQDDDLV